MDAESVYYELRGFAEKFGFVSDAADELLGSAAEAIVAANEAEASI
jgi:hypothetical protein